jgi:hypothetical protein
MIARAWCRLCLTLQLIYSTPLHYYGGILHSISLWLPVPIFIERQTANTSQEDIDELCYA